MIRIGVSQRVTSAQGYQEQRDCLDQRWGPLLESFGLLPIPLFNRISDVETYLENLELGGVVLTGGDDLNLLDDESSVISEREVFEQKLLDFAIRRDLPVLGVCRGAQLINTRFGGSLSSVDGHVATKHDILLSNPPFDKVPLRIITNSYHNYGIKSDDIAENLNIIGYAADGSVEWIEHNSYSVSAIMWHPERDSSSSEIDQRIINRRFSNAE